MIDAKRAADDVGNEVDFRALPTRVVIAPVRSTDADLSRRANEERESVPVASDAERPLPDARRNVPGSTKGK